MARKGISFHKTLTLRDVEALVNVHEGETESLTFIRYAGKEGVYCNIGFHFQHGELKQLAELLLLAHAEGAKRIEADVEPLKVFTHVNGEIVERR